MRQASSTFAFAPGVTINQITWQVGSLQEVTGAEDWLRDADTTPYSPGETPAICSRTGSGTLLGSLPAV